MKTLLVFRHAKSSWGDETLDDHGRPLNQRGKKTAPLMGQWIAEQKTVPELILSSTAKRAVSTVKKAAKTMGYQGEIVYDKHLYLASPSTYLKVVRSYAKAHTRVMIVGHNPGLESLIQTMTGVKQAMPTAALAEIGLEIESWQDLRDKTPGILRHFWLPRELFT